jgi:AcrR family transcriptional regulator
MAKKKSDEEVRNEIIKVANTLFVKYGFHKTTMEDIAKLAGKGKSTLYYYFKSKEEVIIAVMQKIAIEFTNIVRKEILFCNTAEEKLNTYFLTTIKIAESFSKIYYLLRHELADGFLVNPKNLVDFDERGIVLVEDIIRFGYNNKEFTSIKSEDIKYLAELINLTIKSLVMTEMLEIKNKDWDKKILQFGQILIKGIK